MTSSTSSATLLRSLLTLFVLVAVALPAGAYAQDAPDQDRTPDDVITGVGDDPDDDADTTTSILFIGNSYTACAGAQPNLVPALMRSTGRKVSVQTHIRAGETLEGFWLRNAGEEPTYWEKRALARQEDEAAREAYLAKLREGRRKTIGTLDAALAKGPYDVVVLQSWTGARMPEEDLGFQKYARLLADKIRESSPDARLVLYMTWTSQNDRDGQAIASANCYEAARRNDMVVAPAGEAAWAARDARDDLKMYRTEKDSHPGHDGAYLIACTLYAAVTGESPVGLPNELMIPPSYDFPIGVKDPDKAARQKELGDAKEFKWEIAPDKARFLQEAAWAAYAAGLQKTAQEPAPREDK